MEIADNSDNAVNADNAVNPENAGRFWAEGALRAFPITNASG
ncbi:hypothetical protein [Saccharopolyspora sp. ASAGF58]|nr:hypothetical protein [Saccharopolyspora sp. ASAGF58]